MSNNSDDLYKKFKMRSIILAIILSLCAIACIVQMGIPVKADVLDNNMAESVKQNCNIKEEKINPELIKESLRDGLWTAAIEASQFEDPHQNPFEKSDRIQLIDYQIEARAFEEYIMEHAWIYNRQTTRTITYVRLTDLNISGDTLVTAKIKGNAAWSNTV